MMTNSAVILLSGGLDSLVALDYVKNNTDYNVQLALTFDYGQKALANEINSSKKICEYYNIKHEIVKLDWLKDITKNALVGETEQEKPLDLSDNIKSLWVPNRNALFLNIAACYCETNEYKYIIFGANKEEAEVFSDNTKDFTTKISELFLTSTLYHPQVVAPLINYNKDDIVKIALENNVPLELVWSCYKSGDVHCGKCSSCCYLKKALKKNNCDKYIEILFNDENKTD